MTFFTSGASRFCDNTRTLPFNCKNWWSGNLVCSPLGLRYSDFSFLDFLLNCSRTKLHMCVLLDQLYQSSWRQTISFLLFAIILDCCAFERCIVLFLLTNSFSLTELSSCHCCTRCLHDNSCWCRWFTRRESHRGQCSTITANGNIMWGRCHKGINLALLALCLIQFTIDNHTLCATGLLLGRKIGEFWVSSRLELWELGA